MSCSLKFATICAECFVAVGYHAAAQSIFSVLAELCIFDNSLLTTTDAAMPVVYIVGLEINFCKTGNYILCNRNFPRDGATAHFSTECSSASKISLEYGVLKRSVLVTWL